MVFWDCKKMKYYPIGLNLQNRNCLVVGAGGVGVRKARTLVRCMAKVTVVSPEFDTNLWESLRQTVKLVKREYCHGDLEGMFLVIGATNNRQLNKTIGQQAKKENILFNGADLPELSDFIVPAVVERGDLTIAVSTSGNSPAFAKTIKQHLEHQFGPEYERFLCLMGNIRHNLLNREHDPDKHRDIFKQLLDKGLFDLIKKNDQEQIHHLLKDLLGKNHGVEKLFQEKHK